MLFLAISLFASSINLNFEDVNNDVSKDLSIYTDKMLNSFKPATIFFLFEHVSVSPGKIWTR